MSNDASASPRPSSSASALPTCPIRPLPWPEPGQAPGSARKRHAHNCLSCGGTYECRGPEEIGYCAPICQPCYWLELGSQLRIYKEVVTELERKRSGIERRIGKGFCRSAVARRRKMRNDAGLLLAFGNVLTPQHPVNDLTALSSEAQGGGLHGE